MLRSMSRSTLKCSCLMMLGLVALALPTANGQDKGPVKRSELSLVQVHITTETLPVVEIQGRVIPINGPKLLNQFPPFTGMVIDDKGHVLVSLGYTWVYIDQQNPNVEVLDSQGQNHPARLIGIDQSLMVAVLSCPGASLKRSPFCEHCDFKDGDTIIIPLFTDTRTSQFESARILSVSTGADLSGTNGWTLRIDRPLSVEGAPLLNTRGEVIGLIADNPIAQVSEGPGGGVTILPDILTVTQMLSSAEKIIKAGGDIQSGWLGVSFDPKLNDGPGVMITSIERDSPANRAGMLPGDIMTKWNGSVIRDPLKLMREVENTPLGSKAAIEVLREGRAVQISAVIEARKPQDNSEKMVLSFPQMMSLSGASSSPSNQQLQSVLGIDALALTPQLAGALQLPVRAGLLIYNVSPGTSFAVAGIEALDVILTVDGVQVQNPQALYDHIKSRGWGGSLVLRFIHKGKELSKTIQLPKLGGTRKHPF